MSAAGARAWLLVGALAACHTDRHREGATLSSEAPAPSVIQIGVALGGCGDVAVCERECDAGSADRCRRLGVTYATGGGVPRDEARATGLYEHACDMKDWPACVFAGQMHEFHRGVAEDDAAAARFYERACGGGWAAGCYNLAIMAERGRGVPQDTARAAALYDVACAAGGRPACARAHELRGERD